MSMKKEITSTETNRLDSSVTYPAIWRCGCESGGCASLKEMIHLQWETTASPAGDLL